MRRKIEIFKYGLLTEDKLLESLQGWNAYAKFANSFKLRKEILSSLRIGLIKPT